MRAAYDAALGELALLLGGEHAAVAALAAKAAAVDAYLDAGGPRFVYEKAPPGG